MEIYPCGLSPVIFTVIGASVIQVITIYFTITEAEADIVLFNQDSVWEDFQSKLFPILTCNLESAEPILLIVSFKSSRSYTIQEAICSVESTNQNLTVMSPWWNKSSSKEAKKKTSGGGIFGLLKRKLKGPSESKQISSRRCSEIASEMRCNPQASSPSTLVAQFAERPHTYPLLHPENLSVMGRRVDSGKWTSRNRESGKGSSPLFLFPLPKSDVAQNGHDQTDVEGDLATDSVFTDSDSDEGLKFNSRILSPQVSNYVTGNKSSTNSPSSHVTFVTQKEREKLKRVKACVSYQMSPGSPKRYPLSCHMVHLQIPQSTSFFSAPDSSMSTPSRSPMRVFGPEPTPTSGFWAMRPYTDTSFLGPGLCSSPGLGHNPSHKEIADQSFWQHSRCSCECSPMPSPRMTSPSPSSRPVTPLHPWAGGSNMDSSAYWPDGAVNGKQQTHRLPLPPLAVSNTGTYSPLNSTRTTPTIPKSPGRADLFASHGSGWKKGRLLGRGTFGQVYLGFNSERGEMCAMKEVTLFSDDARSKESAQQLAQEIALLSRLRHPNIVQYYGSETVDDKLYIYLEYVSGGSIYRLLQEYGEFGEIVIRSYTRQILLGLAYLHSTNTVHRDIKGANILVEPNGRVKLADFGMAKHITGPSCSLSFKGSPHWMAPEIINNNSDGCNLVVDIWSLGCTVLEMATTKPPWSQFEGVAALFKVGHSQEVQAIPDHLSDDAKDFILQCLQKAPSLRPSAAQLLQHPFVNNIPSSERLILNPGPITNAMGSLDIGHASEGVSVLQSSRHMPHNISSPVSHMGSLLRTGQNVNRRLSLSPISSPRTILGSSAPLTGAAGGGAVPFYHNSQKPYTPEFTGLTLTSRSPTRSFGRPSNALHLLDPKPDMFRPMPQGSPVVQEMVPPDNDFQGNRKKHMAGKSVLVDHGSQKLSKHHIIRYPHVIIKPTSPVVGRREQR